MGSVKDLEVLKPSVDSQSGQGKFIYSDRYSVFDWGEMPDQIPHKGHALCMIGAYFFEKLNNMGIPSHYLGLYEKGTIKPLTQLSQPSKEMAVELVRVLKPVQKDQGYDYSMYDSDLKNILVPLEIIFRNTLPSGSSVFRRLENGSLTLADLGLNTQPIPGMRLEKPLFDVSTKLEATDRYLSWDDAQKISGLTSKELTEIKRITQIVNNLITREVAELGLTHEDGKIEFGFDEKRNLILVDVLGTPDECRFLFEGISLSKEVARIYYRNTPWYEEIEKAKEKDRHHWKSLVSGEPPPLPPELKEAIAHLYQIICNELTHKTWFNVPSLKETVRQIQKFI